MRYILVFLLLAASVASYSQLSIQGKALLKNIEYLASDELAGRWPGSAGDSAARKYIINHFKRSDIQPLGNNYEQYFNVTLKIEAPETINYLKAASGISYELNKEWRPYPFSGNRSINAPVIVAGNLNASLRALASFKNSLVLIWRKKLNAPPTDSLSDYALASKAIQKGAAGVILITPDSLDAKDALVRLRPRKEVSLSAPVLQLKRETYEKLLPILQMQQSIANATDTFFISKQHLAISVKIEPVSAMVANIVGTIHGSDPKLKNEYIILGAHYDHHGYGGYGTGSLKPDTTAIHNGADDNASGTSALLEISKLLSQNKLQLKRSVVVVAFAAEEEGLLGSQYFVSHLPVPYNSIKIMLNMDMVGRLNSENQLYMGGAGTFPDGVAFMKTLEEGSGLKPVIHAGGVGGSDHVSFYTKGISCIGFHTGGHPQYHTPEDDANLINVEGIEKVAKYIYRTIVGLSNRENGWGFVKQD